MKALYLIYPIGYHLYPELKTQKASKTLKPVSGVQAYLINLDQSKKRLAYVRPKIKALGYPFERIRAIDGQNLTQKIVRTFADEKTWFKIHKDHISNRKGTLACSLSHIKTWKRFLQSKAQYALIFEDDITFNPQTLRSIVSQLKTVPKLWDIVNFNTKDHKLPLNLFNLKHPYHAVIYLKPAVLAGAYLINRKAAQHLTQLALPVKEINDHFFIRSWELKTKFIGVEPRVAFQKAFVSDRIQLDQIKTSKQTWAQKFLIKSFNQQTNFMFFYHHLKFYLIAKMKQYVHI